jgi:hypothetical protein
MPMDDGADALLAALAAEALGVDRRGGATGGATRPGSVDPWPGLAGFRLVEEGVDRPAEGSTR